MFDKKEQELAKNPQTPPDILNELAYQCGLDVKRWIVRNPNTSAKTLAFLAEDLKGKVLTDLLTCIASHPNTPIKILEKWANPEPMSAGKDVFFALFNPMVGTQFKQAKQILAQTAQLTLLRRQQK